MLKFSCNWWLIFLEKETTFPLDQENLLEKQNKIVFWLAYMLIQVPFTRHLVIIRGKASLTRK